MDRVPNDMLVMVHKDESIMSAPLAQHVRDTVGNGNSGGGGHTFNVHYSRARKAEQRRDAGKRRIPGEGAQAADALWGGVRTVQRCISDPGMDKLATWQ